MTAGQMPGARSYVQDRGVSEAKSPRLPSKLSSIHPGKQSRKMGLQTYLTARLLLVSKEGPWPYPAFFDVFGAVWASFCTFGHRLVLIKSVATEVGDCQKVAVSCKTGTDMQQASFKMMIEIVIFGCWMDIVLGEVSFFLIDIF